MKKIIANQPNIYLDLDGVMADFDRYFPDYFGVDHRSLADDELWEKINSHETFFADMPPCPGAQHFFNTIANFNVIVCTACPRSNYANVARQKRGWVRRHLSHDLPVLPVMGGKNKALFMHAPGDILIDDFDRNIKAWEEEGGVGILHTDFETTYEKLLPLLKI